MSAPIYTLQDLAFGVGGTSAAPTGGVWGKLSQRGDLLQLGVYQWLQDAILELSRDYRFQYLEKTGPTFNLTIGTVNYPLNTWLQAGDAGKQTNLLPSITRFFTPTVTPGQTNACSTLLWKTIDALELMFQTPGVPTYFTRFSGQIWIAPQPNVSYPVYMRYQVEHPFSNPPASTDTFYLDNEWKEIAEYAASLRGATNLRMMDYATMYHNILFGDPEFQRSSGGRGMPGLIFRRITQMEGDSESMPRQIKPNVTRQGM
jgi:hypothetical protein